MAWTISNAMMKDYENSLCLRGQEEEFSEVTCLDGELSAQLNITPMPDQYYWPDKTTEHSRLSRFGMTLEPLTESLGEELLTWYLAGFPVRTLASQEKVQDSTEKDQDFGLNKHGSFAKYSQDSRMWKTVQLSLLEDLELSLEIWPQWGSMRNGVCFHAKMSVEFIYENESGLSLPTPTASDGTTGSIIGQNDMFYMTKNGTPRKVNQKGTNGSVGLSRMMMLMIPTPRSCSAMAAQITQKTENAKFNNLETVIARLMLPTIGANEGKGSRKKRFIGSKDFHGAKMSEGLRICETDPIYLNPLFAELLMMWPLGWTDLKPLEMGKFQEWQQQHGQSLNDT